MQKKLHLLFALLIFFVSQAMAQITTSSLSGKITANNEDVIGATIKVTHEPSGTVYGATTNANGRYSIQGLQPYGGPYKVEVSYIGYSSKVLEGCKLAFGTKHRIGRNAQRECRVARRSCCICFPQQQHAYRPRWCYYQYQRRTD